VNDRRTRGCLIEIVQTLVLTLVLFWFVQSFVAQPFQVRQLSMQHTIENNQYVLVDKLTPRFDPYHRGDIVVFAPPQNAETPRGEPFIKRIIAVGGDTLELRDGSVLVNGTRIDEPYLFAVDGVPQPTDPETDFVSWTIPAGQLFVMGDHRARSSDSRAFGPISVESVVGRAWLRYWPLEAFGILPTRGGSGPVEESGGTGGSARPGESPGRSPSQSGAGATP